MSSKKNLIDSTLSFSVFLKGLVVIIGFAGSTIAITIITNIIFFDLKIEDIYILILSICGIMILPASFLLGQAISTNFVVSTTEIEYEENIQEKAKKQLNELSGILEKQTENFSRILDLFSVFTSKIKIIFLISFFGFVLGFTSCYIVLNFFNGLI
jgi:hypothetical protein